MSRQKPEHKLHAMQHTALENSDSSIENMQSKGCDLKINKSQFDLIEHQQLN